MLQCIRDFRVYAYTRYFNRVYVYTLNVLGVRVHTNIFCVLEFLTVYGLLIKSDLLFTLYSYMSAVINVIRYLFDVVSWTSIIEQLYKYIKFV